MWESVCEPIDGGLRYRLFKDGRPMTYVELVRDWLRELAFQEFFSGVLANAPIPVFRFELHPLANGMLHEPCEFVLLESPVPDRTANSEGFAEWSFPIVDYPTLGVLAVRRMFHRLTTGETNAETIRLREARDPSYGIIQPVVSFLNVTNDAVLVVPSPRDAESVYAHPAAFFRGANEHQRGRVWGCVADTVVKWGTMNANVVLHVGTPPNAPPWFHLRVDQKPWLTYPPYRDFVPPPLPPAPPPPPPAPPKAAQKRARKPKGAS